MLAEVKAPNCGSSAGASGASSRWPTLPPETFAPSKKKGRRENLNEKTLSSHLKVRILPLVPLDSLRILIAELVHRSYAFSPRIRPLFRGPVVAKAAIL